MITFNRIEYPKCPYCLVEINDTRVFTMAHFQSPYFHLTSCLNKKCKEKFLMKVRTELTVEVVPVEDL